MDMKPFISVDIETTHLDPEKGQLLEIGAVYVPDAQISLYECPTFRATIKYGLYRGSGIALSMNANLIKEIEESKEIESYTSPGKAVRAFEDWIKSFNLKRATFAGKNIEGFDLPWLRKNGFNLKINHRVIDVGSVYWSRFGYNPSLDEICKLIEIPPVSHTALGDAKAVAWALCYAWQMDMED